MQVYALELEDFCEEEYFLIGIHSTLEDYKLAYLLNKNLSTRFYKAKKNLEFVREKIYANFKRSSDLRISLMESHPPSVWRLKT